MTGNAQPSTNPVWWRLVAVKPDGHTDIHQDLAVEARDGVEAALAIQQLLGPDWYVDTSTGIEKLDHG